MHLFAEKSMEDDKTLEGTVWGGCVILSEDYQSGSKKMKLEAGKLYRTRSGNIARVYATDGIGSYPVHGAIAHSRGAWEHLAWTESGRFNLNNKLGYLDIVAELEEPKPIQKGEK